MNIKNILCAILMMSAAFGHSVAVAGCPPSFDGLGQLIVEVGVGLVGTSVGAGIGGTLGYQQGAADSLSKKLLKTLAGGAVGAAAGLAGIVLTIALIEVLNNKRFLTAVSK